MSWVHQTRQHYLSNKHLNTTQGLMEQSMWMTVGGLNAAADGANNKIIINLPDFSCYPNYTNFFYLDFITESLCHRLKHFCVPRLFFYSEIT